MQQKCVTRGRRCTPRSEMFATDLPGSAVSDHVLLEAGAGADVPHALAAAGVATVGSVGVSLSTSSWCGGAKSGSSSSSSTGGVGSLGSAGGFSAGKLLASPIEDHDSDTLALLGVAHPAAATSSLVDGTSGKSGWEGGAFTRCCFCLCR